MLAPTHRQMERLEPAAEADKCCSSNIEDLEEHALGPCDEPSRPVEKADESYHDPKLPEGLPLQNRHSGGPQGDTPGFSPGLLCGHEEEVARRLPNSSPLRMEEAQEAQGSQEGSQAESRGRRQSQEVRTWQSTYNHR